MFVPPNAATSHVALEAFTGRHVLLYLLPRPLRLRVLARSVLASRKVTEPPKPGAFSFSLPGETAVYEILDLKGATRPFRSGARQ